VSHYKAFVEQPTDHEVIPYC